MYQTRVVELRQCKTFKEHYKSHLLKTKIPPLQYYFRLNILDLQRNLTTYFELPTNFVFLNKNVHSLVRESVNKGTESRED